MDFEFDDTARAVIDAATAFLDGEIAPHAAQYREHMVPKERMHALLRSLAPFGFFGTLIPEEAGGSGLDFTTSIRLYEELFRVFPALAGTAFVNQMVGYGLHMDGTDEQKRRYLPGLLTGERIGCQAATEPEAGSNPKDIRMRATAERGGFRLKGRKVWISNGSIADFCIALVRTDDGQTNRMIIDRDGYSARELETLGQRGWSTAELLFDDTWVPEGNRMTGAGAGAQQTLRDFTVARCFAAAMAVGTARAALDAAVDYARSRHQWGKPIGQHQLIQEMVADMATELDCARLLTYRAAWMVQGDRRADTQASMAKYYASEAALRIASKAVQIHGALGLSRDLPVESYFRDARMISIPDGTTQLQQLIIARNLLGMAAFTDAGAGRAQPAGRAA